MSFRLNAIQLFLTYPQCDCPKEEALAQLMTKEKLEIQKAVVGHELHKEEGEHLHVFIKLSKKINLRTEDYLDLYYEGKSYHGNYQTAKSWVAVSKYVMKDGDYICHNMDP